MYTNSYLYDPDVLHIIEEARKKVLQELNRLSDRLKPGDIEICLHDYVDEDDDLVGCYYICNTKTEEICWLTEVSAKFFNEGADIPIVGKEHLRECHVLRRPHMVTDGTLADLGAHQFYWQHIYMFPHGRHISDKVIQELSSELNYWIVGMYYSVRCD